MKRLVIFGAGDMARVAQFYFSHDSEYEVAAFTVHEKFVQGEESGGLPLVAFETVEEWYAPDEFEMFVAVGYKQLNRARAEVYGAAKKKNYRLASYVSSKAVYFGEVNCGDNCFILEANVIQPFVTIGNNVVLWSGNHVGHDVAIEDHCFVSSHVVLSGHVTGWRVLVSRRECLCEGWCDDWRELPDRARGGDSQRYAAGVGPPGGGHAGVSDSGGAGGALFDRGARRRAERHGMGEAGSRVRAFGRDSVDADPCRASGNRPERRERVCRLLFLARRFGTFADWPSGFESGRVSLGGGGPAASR